ncbi:ORF6N domain-containing protein [Leyella stercorea]|uniref:ORF6N domain-containing protein n=1 Tax=Leyella stercorea TaxID=363265 RepID=UPI0024330E03|nr:ORF6N domain-containing protein [Leyella stercorea]
MTDIIVKTENGELVTNRDQLVVVDNIESLIKVIRGQQVILDRDLATLYGVETKRLNEQVKRNTKRFPEDFMFQLTKDECLRSQIATLNEGRGQHLKYMPYVFTEPKQGVFYNGQVYDAYTFVSDLIKSAKKRIILIDNYVDETVLTLLDKRGNSVSAIIYTQQISRQFQLDIDRHNAQYAPIDVETFRLSHDRFLCIDDDVYHIGASIKDLGKKWFGFSKMEILTPDELVERINKG